MTDLVLQALKEVFPTVSRELNNSVSLNKAFQGGGNWEIRKDILGWAVDTAWGSPQLPKKRISKLSALIDTPSSQRRFSVDKLRRLIVKLIYMHMSVPGAIGHFYHIQLALTCVVTRRCDYLSKGIHQDVLHWRKLCRDVLNQPTFLVEVVQRLPTVFGFCNSLVLGSGGVCIDTNGEGSSFVWCLTWPTDIMEDLVRWSNPLVRITNSDLELASLVMQ